VSYTSTSTFSRPATLEQIIDVVELLDYKRFRPLPGVRNLVRSYTWADSRDYKSHSGVELDIYRTPAGAITLTTRSTVSRSYWDLSHQNRTLKLLRDLFGGHFVTDAGRNRYWRPEGPEPIPAESGCMLARWHFHNSLMIAHVYLDARQFGGELARSVATGLHFIDRMNPRFLSNNMFLPYLVAIWEDYFKSTYIALLKYSKDRKAVLKRARLSHEHLEEIAIGTESVESALAGSFTFQRPSVIAEHFRSLDPRLDLAAAFRRPYRRRRVSLYDSIETLVESRHEFVHTGNIQTTLTDSALTAALSDFEAAIDRAYVRIYEVNRWPVNRDYR
jgi:hypothetical protein